MLPDPVLALLAAQQGVVSRRQLERLGARPHDLQRWRRQRLLVPVHAGVYVDHTGVPTWRQRAMAAVLLCTPAALWGASAIHAHEGTDGGAADIEVAVRRDRRVIAPVGIRVVRRPRLDERVQWNLVPPRQRYDDAVVDRALTACDLTASVDAISRAVRQRRTTAARLRRSLEGRPRAGPRGHDLARVLADVESGAHSVLEHRYLVGVERVHDLPGSRRQEAAVSSVGRVYRDVTYGDLVVELDGRATHDTAAQRDADFERDLDTALAGFDTCRLTYGQVVDRACATAGKIARLLAMRGWLGRPTACGAACEAVAVFDGSGPA